MKNQNLLSVVSVKKVSQKGSLNAHVKILHEMQKTCECQLCEKEYKISSTLNTHGKVVY
jgi:hypothetical protein